MITPRLQIAALLSQLPATAAGSERLFSAQSKHRTAARWVRLYDHRLSRDVIQFAEADAVTDGTTTETQQRIRMPAVSDFSDGRQ